MVERSNVLLDLALLAGIAEAQALSSPVRLHEHATLVADSFSRAQRHNYLSD